jgi:hypothetical protein
VASVANYIDKFKRCVLLFRQSYELNTVAFLVGLSVPLAEDFYALYSEAEPVEHRRKELESFGQKNEEIDPSSRRPS